MHTTVTLDPDAEALIHRLMQERSLSFKSAVNEAIRAGIGRSGTRRVVATPVHDLGRPANDHGRLAEATHDAEAP